MRKDKNSMKHSLTRDNSPLFDAKNEEASLTLPHDAYLAPVSQATQPILLRMFADPRTLEKEEVVALVTELCEAVAKHPQVANLRVLYGMALCVNLDVHKAVAELQEAVRLAPTSFVAHLKMGELWMRLRVCRRAEEHTLQAARLAQNGAQSELARRQAASIRTMLREGIERDGNLIPSGLFQRLFRSKPRLWNRTKTAASLDVV
jgi:hypothetical protein